MRWITLKGIGTFIDTNQRFDEVEALFDQWEWLFRFGILGVWSYIHQATSMWPILKIVEICDNAMLEKMQFCAKWTTKLLEQGDSLVG